MPCNQIVVVKDPTTHLEVELTPEKVYVIKNHRGKTVKIGLFVSPKTGKYFRALMPKDYPEACLESSK